MEYLIEITDGTNVTHLVQVERDGVTSNVKATPSAYSFCTKFKVKSRAENVAKKIPNARVVPSFGGFVYGTKSNVAAKASPINRSSAYRSI